MATASSQQRPWGHRWRSSKPFILACIAIALFSESFLYSFVVPMVPYILQHRNHVNHSDIQRLTYQIFTLYGLVSIISCLFIGELADRVNSRKIPLIASLVIAFAGTLIFAASTQLPGVFVGRVLQGIGGTAAWIVGLATLRDSIESKDIGKIFGLLQSIVNIGALSGPAVAGVLLELTGYWVTWAGMLIILIADIAMRFAMLEKQKKKPDSNPESANEDSTLMSDTQVYNSIGQPPLEMARTSTTSFYKIMLAQRRVIAGLACSVVYSSMLASYNTTIPTHVKLTFGWGSLPTGLLFALIQGPTIVMSPLCGWLRDTIGTRIPAAIGFILLSPFVWLLGAADQKGFPWADTAAMQIYIVATIGIGLVTNLMSGVGTVEITCTIDEIESQEPGIFGPNGGYSRSYSLSNLSFATGLFFGPLISGGLTDSIGYYRMNCILACICVFTSVMAFNLLESKQRNNNVGDGA